MGAQAGPHRFWTLDGLRGLAAVVVVGWHNGSGRFVPGGYLAVDLFFCLSGFVLCHAYQEKGLSIIGFMRARVVRLYPMYFAGLALGAIIALTYWRPDLRYWAAVASGLVMAPMPRLGIKDYFPFPLNGPAWSLFFEMVINLVWIALLPALRGWVVALLLVVAAGLLVTVARLSGNLNVGSWGDYFVHAGFCRVLYSFFAGTAVYRLWRSQARPAALPAFLALLALAVMLLIDAKARGAIDLLIVIFGFPALVYLAAGSRPTGRWAEMLGAAGALSYGIYVVHYPLFVLFRPWFVLTERLPHALVISGGDKPYLETLLVLPLSIVIAWVLERYYDGPARAWLARVTRPKPAVSA